MHCWCCGQPERTEGCVRGFPCGCLFARRCLDCSHCDLHCRCERREGTGAERVLVGEQEVRIYVRFLRPSSIPLVDELAGTGEGEWLAWVSRRPNLWATARTREQAIGRLADKLLGRR